MGQIIGAVIADTQRHAQLAAKKIRVQYEELPVLLTLEVCASIVFNTCACTGAYLGMSNNRMFESWSCLLIVFLYMNFQELSSFLFFYI